MKMIGAVSGHPVRLTRFLNPAVYLAGKIPGKISGLANKAFGNMVYDKEMSKCFDGKYQISGGRESISKTEGVKNS